MSGARLLGRRPHDPLEFAGRVEFLHVASEVLTHNPLGDPAERELPVYLPPGAEPAGLPLLVVLAGFTGRGQAYVTNTPWKPGLALQYDRAVAAGHAPPAVLAFPDCFTRLGGSQYLDSSAVGHYQTHVVEELVPLLQAEYGLSPTRCGVVGKSSGGFGALTLAMHAAAPFQAAGSISGDCGFDALFPGEFLACLRGLLAFDMDPARYLREFEEQHDLSGDGHAIINTLAMAACYSPNPESPLGFDLPFDLETGERIEPVWQRWLEHDPLVSCERHAERLAGLRLLHIECGLHDEFHLQWGTRRLTRALTRLGVGHSHEEHPGGHFGTDGRYLALFPRLIEALASA